VSIGQGQLLVTPLQVALMTARIATKGRRVSPHILRDVPPPPPDISGEASAFKDATFESVIEGMWRSVNADGTGKGAHVEGMNVCGKTGSTQLISREMAERLAKTGRIVKTHSWFSGFAPRVHPRIVVTVLVEYGGGGGEVAAPLAAQIFALYRELYLR
jgi:cell division protein FtsI/penicillin-binding protein 2